MKIISAGLLSAILVAGVAGSFAAYRSQTAQDVTVQSSAAAAAPAPVAQAVHPGTKFRWAPCPKGSRLVHRACVTDVVKTVVVPAAPVYVAAASTSSSGGGGRSSGYAEHEGAEHESEHGDARGEDHADDHGDDGGEDHGDGGEDHGGGGEDHGDD